MDELYLYNHLRFTITYQEDPSAFEGVRITGFDVHPVSIENQHDGEEAITSSTKMSTCNKPGARGVVAKNLLESHLPLRTGPTGEPLKVVYSYEVEWVASNLPWADRWDFCMFGLPVGDLHYYAMLNAVIVASLVACFIVDMIIRTTRQDVAGYIEVQHSKKQRPQQLMLVKMQRLGSFLRVMSFAQLVVFLVLACAALRVYNHISPGVTLTVGLFLNTMCGFNVMLNVFMFASLVACFIVGTIIRTSRQDIAGYIEMQALEEATTTTTGVGQDAMTWQLLEGDVFRPPQFSPMFLSVLVGTGVQIGIVFFLVLVCAALRVYNPQSPSATLTVVLFLYAMCGFASGYVSARLHKFCNSSDDEDWKTCAAYTSIALPGGLLVVFCL